MTGEEIKFDNLKVGMKVIDDEQDIAKVIDCSDIHNVELQYGSNGKGFVCMEASCENEKLYNYVKNEK